MENNSNNIFHYYYKDPNFSYKEDKFQVSALLKIGFLMCWHYSEETQLTDLWILINPKLEDSIPLDTVIEFIKELMYIAVDIPENMLKD